MANKTRVGVEVRNGNLNKAISIFKKKVSRSGILYEYRENQEYTKPSAKRREAHKVAVREERRRRRNEK